MTNAIHHEGATSDNEFLRTSFEYVDCILRDEYAEYGTFRGREHRIFPWHIQMSHEFNNYNVPIQGLDGSTPATALDALRKLDGLLGQNFFNYMSVFITFAHGSFQYPFTVPPTGNTKVAARQPISEDITALRQRVVTEISAICDIRLLFRTEKPLLGLGDFKNIYRYFLRVFWKKKELLKGSFVYFSLLRVVFGNKVTEDLITQLFRDLRYHIVKHFPLEIKNRTLINRYNKNKLSKLSNAEALSFPFSETLWTRATQNLRDDEIYLAKLYGYSIHARPKLPPVHQDGEGKTLRTVLTDRAALKHQEKVERNEQKDITQRMFMNQVRAFL